MQRTLSLTYLGTVVGFLMLLLNSSVWLEMRINTALVLPLFTLAGLLFSLRRQYRISLIAAIVLQFSVLLLFFVKYGFEPEMLSVMPAMLLREGFHLKLFDLQVTNFVLTTIIALGNISMALTLWTPWKFDRLSEAPIQDEKVQI